MSSIENNQEYFYEFGPFRLSETEAVLRRDAQILPPAPKAVDLLLILVRNAGHVLPAEDLLKSVWVDCVVEPNNLHIQIAAIRKAVGKEMIKTLPKRGYQFMGEVRERWHGPSDAALVAPEPPVPVASSTTTVNSASSASLKVRAYSRSSAVGVTTGVLIVAAAWLAFRNHQLSCGSTRPSSRHTGLRPLDQPAA